MLNHVARGIFLLIFVNLNLVHVVITAQMLTAFEIQQFLTF